MKTIILLFAFAILATMGAGCCTNALVDTYKETLTDTFTPSAVYQTTNHNNFALEGIRRNALHDNASGIYSTVLVHSFILIPEKELASANLQTNTTLSLADIEKLPSHLTLHLESINELPSSYVKIADLPQNDVNLVISKHHPGRVIILFLPVSVAFDVVTSPIQLAWSLLVNWAWEHGHT